MLRFHILLVFAFLAACTDFPQLDGVITDQARQSDYPGLQPVDALLARADDPAGYDAAKEIEALRARAKLLQSRAGILRRTDVIDSDAQARMKAAFLRLTQ